MTTLLEKLDRERQKLGMTHQQFAGHLGISEVYWQKIRNSKIKGNPGSRFFMGIMGKFPGLGVDVAAAHAEMAGRKQAEAVA